MNGVYFDGVGWMARQCLCGLVCAAVAAALVNRKR